MISLEKLCEIEYISRVDLHLARALTRLGSELDGKVTLAVALTSRAVRESHVCLDFEQFFQDPPVLQDEKGNTIKGRIWPSYNSWLDALSQSLLVGGPDEKTPLVLDDRNRLYLRRYWDHETSLSRSVAERAAALEADVDPVWLRMILDRLFAAQAPEVREIDWQRIAAVLALQRRLCVISGGPGTGKTFTVVKILALLIELAHRRGERPPRITLMAPTGKAAARLNESIRKAKGSLDISDEIKNEIPETAAQTIHRCLQSIGGSSTRFRHDASNPLLADVVLVDEASMVDVGLMARLAAATLPHARLILLGDQNQLASVEAGAVLGDICNSGAPHSYSHELAAQIERLTGDVLPAASDAPVHTGIWDSVVRLTRSYRYAADSGIDALARAIHDGDADTALQLLCDEDRPDVQLFETPVRDVLSPILKDQICRGFEPSLRQEDPVKRLRALDKFRVLCAHRHGPGGAEVMNQLIEEALMEAELVDIEGEAYVGRPVIVTKNAYPLRLFNGDVGVVVAGSGGMHRLVVFEGEKGELREFALSRLPPHETVFAMSVHKSQGSEFDDIVVVLPDEVSPILSRELLYTAVTRARKTVAIYGSPDVVHATVQRRVERASGLRERLWGSGLC